MVLILFYILIMNYLVRNKSPEYRKPLIRYRYFFVVSQVSDIPLGQVIYLYFIMPIVSWHNTGYPCLTCKSIRFKLLTKLIKTVTFLGIHYIRI